MTARERVLNREYQRGRAAALEVQERSADMTGTELNAVDDRIPQFAECVKRQNMLTRSVGFVCKSTAGRVVKLLQVYDSDIYTAEPEELPAQWGFQWSTDPRKALPFIAISTSPYNKGECCTWDGVAYCSVVDNNVWSPADYPAGWEVAE